MKKFPAVAVLLAGMSTSVNAQIEEKRYSLTLSDPDSPMVLEVDMHNGSVEVLGYDGKSVEIIANMSPLTTEQMGEVKRHRRNWQDSHNADKVMRDTQGLKPVNNVVFNLEIEEANNRVEIESEMSLYQVDVQVKVPFSASVDAEIHQGKGIQVKGLTGKLELETFRGDITATDISGPIVAETHQNDIVITFARLSESAPSSFTTYSGDVDVTLTDNIASDVHVKNFQGQILSGLDAEFVASESVNRNDKKNKKKIVVGGQVSAAVNGGGQDITIRTFSGNVYLRKAQ